MEIMHFTRFVLVAAMGHGHGIGGYLCLAILTSNEECHLSRNTTCFGVNGCMCYDYVHLDNLSDISAYRTVVEPQHTTMQQCNIHGLYHEQ